MNKKFVEINKRLDRIETKLNNFTEDYKSKKLPMRIEYIENILNLSKIK